MLDHPSPPPRVVEATLNYLKPIATTPRRYVEAPPPGEPRTNIEDEPRRVGIENGRGREGAFTLDRHGFALIAAPSRARELEDEAEIRARYIPEQEALLRWQLAASRVLIFDHTVRGAPQPGQPERMPVLRVHNDYTWTSARQRVRDLLPAAEAAHVLAHRFAIVNVWRPIGAPALATPLALCDGATIAENDLVAAQLIYPDRVGETFLLRFNPTHRWYYFHAVRPEEALLIKCYDSATDRTRLAAHGAFEDPTTPADAPPRRSIELRSVVSWAP